MSKEADSQDFLSVQSGRSSAVDHVEEISLESSKKSQDVQVVMSETAGDRKLPRRCTVQEIMIRSTDYLRRITAPAGGASMRYDVILVPAL